MKIHLIILALAAAIGVSHAANAPIDLTGADASKFKEELGHVVILRGRLEEGMQGKCLHGATPKNVVFYVMEEMTKSPSGPYPEAWTRLMHQQVRLTGELKFRSFDGARFVDQPAPSYYYMVLQRTKIERDGAK